MNSIQAVIWDFGGVLTSSPFDAFNRYEAEHGLPENLIRSINATNPESNAWARFESSAVSLDEFDRLFEEESAARGHPVPGRRVIEMLSGAVRPRMVQALRHCKEAFAVACITNNMKTGLGPSMAGSSARQEETERVMALFDLIVESSVEGIRKPDPRIYALTCERLGVPAGACVFLDDLGINLKPARALGMHTIKVLNEDQAIADLQAATGLSLG
ncbi:MAG: HAD-IA family hydrolase [Gammaproteobacteria bacterium]|nr:HAD-IA family hydrolase [Gammaproteobacteria bacterium]